MLPFNCILGEKLYNADGMPANHLGNPRKIVLKISGPESLDGPPMCPTSGILQ